MEIRVAQRSEQLALEAVVAAAFNEPPDGHVVQMIRALDQTHATRVSLVAADDGIVGHVQLSKAWIDARQRLIEILMLTPLAVAPDHQRQGIGTRLVEQALATADQLGSAVVVLEGSPNYYGQRGFVAGDAVGLIRPSLRIPAPAFQVATLSSYEPWMIGTVVYPQAVWDVDIVGLRDPQLASIEAALGS